MSSEKYNVSTSSGEDGSSSEENSRPYRRRLPIDVDVKWPNSKKKERSKIEYEGKLYRFNSLSKNVDGVGSPLYNFYKCDQKGCPGRLWVVGDYQKAPMNAAEMVWPGIKTEGDSFHLHQALCIKQVRINKDKQLYKTNIHIQYPDVRPLFPYSVADMYTSTIEKRPRDNNTMESNNKKLKRLLGSMATPGEWWMARHLRAVYDGDFRLQYLQFVAGQVKHRSAKSVRADKRILAQVQQFTQVIVGQKTMIEWADGMAAAF